MNANAGYEHEIDLRDLMFAVLHRWKMIFIIVLCPAVLLGGWRFFNIYKSRSNAEYTQEVQEQYINNLETYENTKTLYERELENIKTNIVKEEEYLSNSVLMNLSPYDIHEATADIYIETEYQIMPEMAYQNNDYTDSIFLAYQSALTSAAFLKDIASITDLDEQYIRELVSVDRRNVTIEEIAYNKATNILTVRVKNDTEKTAAALLDAIIEKAEEIQPIFSQNIGRHTFKIINRSVGTGVDLDLAEKQQKKSKGLTDLRSTLSNKEKAIAELQEPAAIQSAFAAALKSGIKYGVLGGGLGFFAAILFTSATFLLSDKLYSAKELKQRFDVRTLGEIHICNKKKNRIDAWLTALEGSTTVQNEYALIAANICNYKNECNNVLITGSIPESQLKQIHEKLSIQIPELKLHIGKNLTQEASTLKELPKYDGVILVEQRRESRFNVIEKEVESITDMKKQIIGCIICE